MERARFDIVFSNERIIPASGPSVVGGMLAKSNLVKRLNRVPVDQRKRSEPQIKNWDIPIDENLMKLLQPVQEHRFIVGDNGNPMTLSAHRNM